MPIEKTLTSLTPIELKTFNVLCELANKGDRCPVMDELRYLKLPINLRPLAEKGYIKIEIWVHNWRVIEIREGEHKGKRTAESPLGNSPYKIIWINGTIVNGKPYIPKISRTPSQIMSDVLIVPQPKISKQDEDDAALMESLL